MQGLESGVSRVTKTMFCLNSDKSENDVLIL